MSEARTQQPGEEDVNSEIKPMPGDGAHTALPPSVHEVVRSPGQPLDSSTRVFMEPLFGHNFGEVRVHADPAAAESARSVNASAYTVGKHIVFGEGQYSIDSAGGRQLLAHELTHVVQQGAQSQTPTALQDGLISGLPLQASPDDKTKPKKPEPKKPEPKPVAKGSASQSSLHDQIKDLVDKKITDYVAYKDLISNSKPDQKKAVLSDQALLSALNDTLDFLSFARCVESLGRKAPTFDELKKDKTVSDALNDAWKASDPGIPHRDRVLIPHEEGGWVFMNLIDGTLHIERATAQGTNFIKLEPPPDVPNSVVVALFHTHPNLGPGFKAEPSSDDKKADNRRGVPNLVAGSPNSKPDSFKIFLSGPSVRPHVGSDKKLPGPGGGTKP